MEKKLTQEGDSTILTKQRSFSIFKNKVMEVGNSIVGLANNE